MEFEVGKKYHSRCGDCWELVFIDEERAEMQARFVEAHAEGHEVIMGKVYRFALDGVYNQGGIHDLVEAAEH